MSARKRGKGLLAELEQQIRGQGVKLSYEKLQFGGLRLKSGLCWFKGKYYLFVDRYKPLGERIDLLEQALDELATLPEASEGPPTEESGEAPAEAAPQDQDAEPESKETPVEAAPEERND